MRIAIIGAGFTGLSAAYYLAKQNHAVEIFEQDKFVGGLGAGMKNAIENFPPEWEWDLEQFYHHWFTNDDQVFNLGREIGVENKFIIKRPHTKIIYQDRIFSFDSPTKLLTAPILSPIEKLRVGMDLARLKYLYNEQSSVALENISAHDYLIQHQGKLAYEKLWEPLLKGKFHSHYQDISMRWFWARIYKRTAKLAYYEGGFAQFAQDVANQIEKMGGQIHKNARVHHIHTDESGKLQLTHNSTENQSLADRFSFDRVIVTTPPPSLVNILDDLPNDYSQKLSDQKGLGAFTLTLSLHHPLMPGTYWLNVNNEDWPFLAVVEHTNFMPKEKYNNKNIVYIGNYLPADHPLMQKNAAEMINEFTPYLKEINPLFSAESVRRSFLFKVNYAQPIVGLNHQDKILPIQTPIKNVYLASMAQVYPWDRGTNYAIEMGRKVVDLINHE